MSKKKNKFKKQLKAQLLEEIAKAPTASGASINTTKAPETPEDESKVMSTSNSAVQNLDQIKYDLKKTTILIGALALIIVALVLLDQKYGILLSFGASLFKVLHIQ